jgi:hypothetical protein
MQPVFGLSTKEQVLERVGDMRQLAGFQRMVLAEGKGSGNEVIQVRNGSGLQFQVSVSRAFDIGLCELHGIPLSWMSHTGPVAPAYYEKDGTEWGLGFEGGLLATCGLSTIGKPSVDEGVAYGQHGRISYTPAELLQSESRWGEQGYETVLRGKVKEVKALEQHVVLERTITTSLGRNRIVISDKITNEWHKPTEHLIMYHFNFGYPLVSETCEIRLPDSRKRWINGEGPTADADRYDAPSADARPTVMLHEDLHSEDGLIELGIRNEVIHNGAGKRLQLSMRYSKAACPFLTQWKYPAEGIYVLGLEPGNATTEGRRVHREKGTMPYLQPYESKRYEFTLDYQLTDGDSV